MKTVFFGIDPGAKGALAIIEGRNVKTVAFDEQAYIDALRQLNSESSFGVVEQVHSMPGQGVVSTFSFGENYGYIKGILNTLGLWYDTVTPHVWTKHYGLTSDKKGHIDKAVEFYPDANYLATPRSRVKSDGIADAILLAKFAEKLHQNIED